MEMPIIITMIAAFNGIHLHRIYCTKSLWCSSAWLWVSYADHSEHLASHSLQRHTPRCALGSPCRKTPSTGGEEWVLNLKLKYLFRKQEVGLIESARIRKSIKSYCCCCLPHSTRKSPTVDTRARCRALEWLVSAADTKHPRHVS